MPAAAIVQLVVALAPYGIQVVQDVIALLHSQGQLGPTGDQWVKALSVGKTPFSQGLIAGSILPDVVPTVPAPAA